MLEISIHRHPLSAAIWRRRWPVVAIVLVLLGFCRQFSNWPAIWDIRLSDEGIYLTNALNDAQNLMRDSEFSPLYCLFYRVVAAAIGSDSGIQLYLVGGLLVILLGFLGVGLGVWAASRSLPLTLISLVLFVLLGAPSVWPRISFLTLFVLGVGFAALVSAKGQFNKIAILTLTCYLATYIRAEYALALYLCLVWALIVVARTKLGARPSLREGSSLTIGAFAFAAVGALLLILPFPLFGGSGRAFYAFGQHYAVRAVETFHPGLNPWLDWDEIMKADFPSVRSIFGAFIAKPGLLLEYVFKNAFGIVPADWKSVMPVRGMPWGAFGLAVIGLVVSLSLVKPLRKRITELTSFPRADGWLKDKVRTDAACVAILLVPPTLSIILIFPRDHYILLSVQAFLFLLAAIVRWPRSGQCIPAIAVAAAFVVLARPLPVKPHPTLEAISTINGAGPITHLMDYDAGWCVYLTPRCKPAWAWDVPPDALFPRYLDDNKIDGILVSPNMRHGLARNESFNRFLQSATKQGWMKQDLPTLAPNAFLLVRHGV